LRIALRKFTNLGLMLTHCSHAAVFMHCKSTAFKVWYTVTKKALTRTEIPVVDTGRFFLPTTEFFPHAGKVLAS
jgi:hypothetical protein